MVDSLDRWCLFCDVDLRPNRNGAPTPILEDYVDALIARSDAGEAKRIFERDNRITRVSHARRANLADGTSALAFVVTLGDRRGANPAFIDFDQGSARDAEKRVGEVKGASAHCLLSLVADPNHSGRYRLLMEEVRGIGRTPITRLLASELRSIAEDQGEDFLDPHSGRRLKYRPVIEVNPRQSAQMEAALRGATSMPVTLIDTSGVAVFDEQPDYTVRRHEIALTVRPSGGRTMNDAISALARLGQAQDYDKMRISWRPPGSTRSSSTEMATDLADIGTALFAHRVEVTLENALSECTDRLSDEFIEAMIVEFG